LSPRSRRRPGALSLRSRRLLIGAACALLAPLAAEALYRAALSRPGRCGDPGPGPEFDLYAVGESTALGEPYTSAAAPPDLARTLLGGRLRGLPIRVRNMAVHGESIFPQASRFERAVLCRKPGVPGAVIVYAGHNDAAYSFETPFFEYFKEEVLDRSRILTDVSYWLEKELPGLRVRSLHTFEFNLRRVVEAGLRAGLTPILSTAASNLSGIDPGLQDPRGDDGSFTRAIEAGERLEAAGRARAARDYYRRVQDALPPLRGYLRYRLALCDLRLGERAKARALLRACVEARAPDNFGRATAEQNEVVRRLAREYAVPLVDVEALFAAAAPGGVPGDELFSDGHHPNLRGYALMGGAYARALADAFGAPPPAVLRDSPRVGEELGLSRADFFAADLDSGRWLFSASMEHRHPYQRLRMARERFRAARALAPGDFSPLLGLALADAAERDARAGRGRGWLVKGWLFYGASFAVEPRDWPGLLSGFRASGVPDADVDALARAYDRAPRAAPPPGPAAAPPPPPPARPAGAPALLRAEAAWRRGDRAAALAALDSAETAPLGAADRLATADLYRELGAYGPAARIAEESSRAAPRDAAPRVESAAIDAASGHASSALARLAEAEDLSPDESLRRRMALLYQDLKQYPRALRLLGPLAAAHPRDAAALSDLGLCEFLAGSVDDAVGHLRAAIRLDPGFLPASLTLAGIEAGRGRPREALAIYDAALAQPAAKRDPSREALVNGRREAAAALASGAPR